MSATDFLLIAALGAAGALLRWALTAWVTTDSRALMVVAVNTLGAIGAGVGVSADWGLWATLLAAGLWGSLTTLSTLAVDVADAGVRKGVRTGVWLVALHLIGGVLGVWAGVSLGGLLA